MKNAWRQYLSLPAPRYTSYPSALDFDAGVDADDLAEALSGIDVYEPLSIYVHIPYCRSLCLYCGCTMRVENSYDRALPYIEDLRAEIAIAAEFLNGAGRPSSIHFGGGTPNYFEPRCIAQILDAIEAGLGLTDDVTMSIELDPRLLREGEVKALAELGFLRMSVGVQDFDPEVQTAINRIQPFELVARRAAEMRAAGVADVGFDLIYGLPRQTPESFAATLDRTLSLSPDRIAVFGYAHLPQRMGRQRLIASAELPSPEARAELAELSDSAFRAAGYRRVGFDHYAKPENALARAASAGRLRRSFQGFTEDAAETTLGFGASAVSFVAGLYAQNAKTIPDWRAAVRAGRLATARGIRRSPQDEVFARLISELLCVGACDLAQDDLAREARAATTAALAQFLADGVLRLKGSVIEIADEAWSLRRAVAAAIDPRLKRSESLSGAV